MSFLKSFLKNDKSSPSNNEFEYSLFGGGVGECILLHFGNGEWGVVDSFLYRDTKRPIALEYLEAIGADIKSLKKIIISHWHDDHIRGVSNIIKQCPEAEVVSSSAVQKNEFLKLIMVQTCKPHLFESTGSGVDEYSEAISILKERNKSITYVTANCEIYRKTVKGRTQSLRSLSPSGAEITKCHTQIGNILLNHEKSVKVATPGALHNGTCIVLWGSNEQKHLLLGADLEHGIDPNNGWNAILKLDPPVEGKASIFKISHHGSITGDCDKVWDKLVIDTPHCSLTSNNKSKIPKPTDVARILSRTSLAHIASARKDLKVRRADPAVEKTIKQHERKMITLESRAGLVRHRIAFDTGEISTDYFGAAEKLS